ncbi:TPA: peptide deformylase, partial [Escherichia coli]
GLLAICIGLRLGNGKYCTLRLFFNQV